MNKRRGTDREEKQKRDSSQYRQMRMTIFFRTMLLLFADLVLLYIFVDAFLRGRFANWVVGFLDHVVFRDCTKSLARRLAPII